MKKEFHIATINMFNVIVAEEGDINIDMVISNGVVTNFDIDRTMKLAIQEVCFPLDVNVLFSKDFYDNATAMDLIFKQVMHYVEVYGLNSPGLFNLEMNEGVIITPKFIKAVSKNGLTKLVHNVLYANAPVNNIDEIMTIIKDGDIDYDINKIKNNELRVALYRNGDIFNNGDDAVRYICYKTTENALLIKSPEVINAAKSFNDAVFLRNHANVLAQVFNRHKKIIMACKNKKTKTAINRISKLSKKSHVPIVEAINKKFISLALNGKVDGSVLKHVSVRDKFKYLNLLEYKMLQRKTDAFIIRNGKIHVEPTRPVYDSNIITAVRDMVIDSLRNDFAHLNGKNILLDKNVDYGLPISRKQAIGNLPYGSTVIIDGKISSGVYWRNEWGATDLDLSTIDLNGNRVGWGQYSGYDKKSDISFSGDMTYASDGAMEFMTSSSSHYGLFVNIFSGTTGTDFEIVVGKNGHKKWINDVVIREKGKLKSRGNVVGFVDGSKFTVYAGAINNNHTSTSGKTEAIVQRGVAKFWTIKELFSVIGIDFVVDKEDGIEYDYDISYDSLSYDKLERLMFG